MFKIGVGIGEGTDDYSVGVMAVSGAIGNLRRDGEDYVPGVALLFISSRYRYDSVVSGIRSVLGGDVQVVGTSTAGEITSQGPAIRDSVVVVLFASDSIGFATAMAPDLTVNQELCGQALAESLHSSVTDPARLLVIFSNGLAPGTSNVISALEKSSQPQPVVVGGSSGDGLTFRRTAQIHDDDVSVDAVSVLGFTGNITFSVGSGHGWNPVGAPRTVTESKGTTIISIDNKPAFTFYRDYLGEEESDKLKLAAMGEVALSYPMGTLCPETNMWVMRSPVAINEDGSIECGGEFSIGSKIQLMMGSREDAIKAARTAAQNALNNMTGSVAGALIFSSFIRNTLFAETHASKHELEAIKDVLGVDVPIAGFYSYAEQAPMLPVSSNGEYQFSESVNANVVVVLIGEA